ncbi:TolC family protein [Balneola vulgaris]|uniref:TolC family protein n=1 Tax=Balneola vulgaris TaxID=287535 RepID=UPI00035F4EE0|nr:TolC family protein [Balneola vulgaris]
MNKFILSFAILSLILGSSSAEAQQTQSLTLDQSIEIAKNNSPLSRAATYALISSKWRYKSFKADKLPSLVANGDVPNYLLGSEPISTENGIIYRDFNQSDASLDLSINQNIFPTGGTVSVSSGLGRLGIFKGEERYQWQSTPLLMTLRQPLFQFNALKWRGRLEPLRYRIAEKQFVEDMEDLAFTVTQNFFDLLLAKINMEVSEFNVTVNDSIFNIAKGRFEVGNLAENELLESELAYRNAEASLTTAQLNYKRAEEGFKALLGIDNDVVLEIIAPNDVPDVKVDVDEALAYAIENNSRSLQYELNELQADQAYEQAKKSSGFSATIQATYGLNNTAQDFDELYDNPGNRQFFTVGFQVPIFNWGKQVAEIKAARNQQQATANSIAYQRLQFELDVRSTVREFELLKDQLELAEISDDIAERRYDVSKNRYLIGKIDVTNLFIAQREKDSARRSYVQALRTYWTGYYNLRRLTLFDFEKDEPIYHEVEL